MRNFSIAEKLIATFASGGVKNHKHARLIKPPKRLAVMPILKALRPSPRLAIGKPSKPVQMEEGVPGMLIRMAGMSPPEMPPT
jgi:hypothetical protein